MIRRSFARCALGIAAVVAASAPAGAQQINTGSTGDVLAQPFGSGNTATYGQTFTALSGFTQLDQFTFQFVTAYNSDQRPTGGNLVFRAYIMAWDGLKATGPVLFESGDQNGTNSSSPQTYTFNTGGIAVTGGQVYVAFVNASAFVNSSNGEQALMQQIGGTSDITGEFVYFNNGGDIGALTTDTWDCHDGCNWGANAPSNDVAFTATFSGATATPEPASLVLMGTGFVGIGAFARRRAARTKV